MGSGRMACCRMRGWQTERVEVRLGASIMAARQACEAWTWGRVAVVCGGGGEGMRSSDCSVVVD